MTSCDNSGTMNLNSSRISAVHAPYKYPPRNTIPERRTESLGATLPFPLRGNNANVLFIRWGDGTGTRPDYLVNRDDQQNEGPFGEKKRTKIEKCFYGEQSDLWLHRDS